MSLSHGYTMEDKFGQMVRQVKGRKLKQVSLEITENVAVQFACELKALLHPLDLATPFVRESYTRKPLWQPSNMTLGIEDIQLEVLIVIIVLTLRACEIQAPRRAKLPAGTLHPASLGLLHTWAMVRDTTLMCEVSKLSISGSRRIQALRALLFYMVRHRSPQAKASSKLQRVHSFPADGCPVTRNGIYRARGACVLYR
jgi:hypothetical protein